MVAAAATWCHVAPSLGYQPLIVCLLCPCGQCAAFGLCANASLTYPLCLSVWKGEIAEGGPVVWSRCRTDVYAHQQWQRREVHGGGAAGGGSTFAIEHAGSTDGAAPLCVAVPLPTTLLLGAREGSAETA